MLISPGRKDLLLKWMAFSESSHDFGLGWVDVIFFFKSQHDWPWPPKMTMSGGTHQLCRLSPQSKLPRCTSGLMEVKGEQAPPCTINTLLGARTKGTARDATNAPATHHVANANTTGRVRKHTTYGKQDGCAQLSGHVHRRYYEPTAPAVLVINSGHALRTLLCRKGAAARLLGGAKGIQ